MAASIRSAALVLLLGVVFTLGGATAAFAQAQPGGCGVGATPANPTPGVPGAIPATPADPATCDPGPDGILGTSDDRVLNTTLSRVDPGPDGVIGTADDRPIPLRADTGAGGTAVSGSPTAIFLMAGGMLALVAALALRRSARARLT